MQTPKFKFVQDDLRAVFAQSALLDEWKKRTRAQIRKQLIFDPIEYRDFNEKITSIVAHLRRDVVEGTYRVEPPRRYLSEKSRGLCRQMTLIHPRDLLVLERLSRAVYFELKAKAPSKSAFFEPDDGNFIKGFNQVDHQYGSYASWRRFQKRVFGFARENKFLVVTDVANFYDFINFQHLRNIVASLADLRESILDLLIHVLNRLTWTPDFMPLTQVGMPQIETSATRVLANAMLYEVDKVCEHSAIDNYARFMDDIDVGVASIPAAKKIVRDIDLTLQARQLRLNSSKTRILSQQDAFEHFCIRENVLLSRLEKIIGRRPGWKLPASILQQKYEAWLDRGMGGRPGSKSRFLLGNGSKIHKYILKLIYQVNRSVPEEDLLWLVKNDPGMRSTALRYLAGSKKNNSNLAAISDMVLSGIFVDDEAFVHIAGYLLHAKIRKTAKCINLIRQICHHLASSGDIGLHSAIFLASKFLPKEELLSIIVKHRDRIIGDFWLCRAAAGVCPVFFGTADWPSYHKAIRDLDSEDAMGVLNYLLDVASAPVFSNSLKAYLATPNESFPQRIYYPKVLVSLAAHKNSSISTLVPGLHKVHPALRADPFFREMGFA